MKILVIGSTGRVGSLLTQKLLEENHTVVGTSRRREKVFESPNYSEINLNLTANLEEIVSTIPSGIEAIYFVSGSRGKDLLQVDLDGAVKTMKVAGKLNIKRYVMLSTIFSLSPDSWEESPSFRNYYISKHYADQWLINNTDLNYSILQPGNLKETEGTGLITVNVETLGDNSIDDVAGVLVEILDNPSTYRRVISMHEGNIPIKEAISA